MRRGGRLETMLRMRHQEYRAAKRAWVVSTHPEAKVVGGKDLIFSGKGPPDYCGCIAGGVGVVFDAKETATDRWGFALLKDHQARDLEAAMNMGAHSFLVLGYRAKDLMVPRLVYWTSLHERWWAWREDKHGAASLHLDETAIDIPHADWLKYLEEIP